MKTFFGHLRRTALFCAVALAACGNNIQPEYRISLRGAKGQNALASASSITLEAVGTSFRVTEPVVDGKAPALSLRGLDPRSTNRTTFAVTVNGSAGPLAYGQSPPIALSQEENLVPLTIRIQEFGSLAEAAPQQEIPRLTEGNVITAYALDGVDAPPVPTPLLLGGRSLDAAGLERSTGAAFIFNPFLQALVGSNYFSTSSVGAAAWSRRDGTVWVFGGRIPRATAGIAPEATQDFSGTAERLGVGQYLSAVSLDRLNVYQTIGAPFSRAHAVIAEVPGTPAPSLYVFGGEVVQGEPPALTALNTVVRVDLNPQTPPAMVVQMAPFNMVTPRTRHTANAIHVVEPGDGATAHTEILLFGGGANNTPAAEVFDARSNTFIALGADAGPQRFGHKVIPLQDGRLMVVCGTDSERRPLVDARIYHPASRSFTVVPLPLTTPRTDAACFAVGNDLVVAGGQTTQGSIESTAEVFNLIGLEPVAILPAAPRYGASEALMPDGTILLAGGREPLAGVMVPSNVLEFYRLRRAP